MTPPITEAEVAKIAKGLTKAQQRMVVESCPGGWGRADQSCGVEVQGSGRHASARALVAANLGDIEEDPGTYPPALYFNNALGLAVRAHLERQP